MLKEIGFDWISSLYPPHPNRDPMQELSTAVLDSIVAPSHTAVRLPDGLVKSDESYQRYRAHSDRTGS